MRRKRITIIIITFIANAFVVFAQKSDVQGRVYDQGSGLALPGAVIQVKGTTTASVSDGNGFYSIFVNDMEKDILVVSILGYAQAESVVDGRVMIDFHLEEETVGLDEIVVIGYGTTTRKDVTGSVASIHQSDFNKGAFSDAMGLLQGKIAGLTIVNPNGSDPNGQYEILLRGTNTLVAGQGPLIIIDGVAGADIRDINFQEVESFDVLKDGSAAAIYGTRGTNGVIIITTKRAKSGQTSVEYDGQISTETVSNRAVPLSAEQFEEVIKTYRPELSTNLYGHSTDWFKETTRTPVCHKHNLSVSGGSEKFSHRTVLNLEENQGLQLFNDASKLALRTNIHQSAVEGWLELDYNLYANHREYVPSATDVFVQAFMHNPTEPVYDASDTEAGGWNRVSQMAYYNPVAMLHERNCHTDTDSYGGSARARLNIIPASGLHWDNFISIKRGRTESREYYTKYYPSLIGTNGKASIENYLENDLQWESTVNWAGKVGEFNLQAVGGYTYQYGFNQYSYMSNSDFDTDSYLTNNIGAGRYLGLGIGKMDSYKEDNTYIAFFGRVIANYKDRFLLSVSLRRDGSSRFGADHKWGWFPAVSAGWRLSEEEFIKDISWISDLKLRAGYGMTGNQDFANYKSQLLMSTAGHFLYNGSWINTYQPASNANPDLGWEKKAEFNVGADFLLFDGRIGGSLDYYRRVTSDLLYSYTVPTPPYVFDTFFTNVGQITNQGIEITINAVAIDRNGFKWNTTLTAARNTNVLDSFTNEEFKDGEYKVGWASGGACFSQRLVEGESLGTFWGPVYLGTNQKGEDVLEDQNSKGEVAEEDWQRLGCAYPDLTLGWSNSMTWKGFDLNFQLRASIGGDILNCYALEYDNLAGLNYTNISANWLEHTYMTSLTYKYSSKFIEDATYIKLDNLSLGYTFNFNNGMLKSLRLSLTGQNLLCITGYSGVDPEVSLMGVEPGFGDTGYYPTTRRFTLGLNLKF